MKKFLLVIFFAIAFNSYAQSNWVYVASNSYGDDYLVDRASVQPQGDSITFWHRSNYKQRTEMGNLSDKIQSTINCRTREFIMRYSMYYDDINNTGQMTGSGKVADASWVPIAPDTTLWIVYKFVCK